MPLLLLLLGCRETLRPGVLPPDRDPSRRWEQLLSRVVDREGYVDYGALESDRGPLDDYVAWLATDEAWEGKLTKDWHAQFLNAYNALVLYQVLIRGRPASVLDVRGTIPVKGFKFFRGTQFRLGDDLLSLSEIEHERIRWKEMDYRDHAAINCASRSCPPLRGELYRTNTLQTQLDDQMRVWIMDEDRGVRVTAEKATFSPIFEWYARDFSFWTAGEDICSIAADHATGTKRQMLYRLAERGCPHDYFEYDWSLNESK